MAEPDPRALLAYEQARGRLERQVHRIGEMRATTNFLLAATALVASFLGREAVEASRIDEIETAAIAALVLGVLCGIRPLWPIRDHEPRRSVSKLLRVLRLEKWAGLDVMWRGNVSADEILGLESNATTAYSKLAKQLEHRAKDNGRLLDKRLRWLMACALLLAAQVILWSLALVIRG